MKLPRRKFLHLAAGAAALPAVSRIARAQTYPSRSVRMIVPYGPDGPTDVFARLIAQKLTENLGQQFFVENIGGAGGNIGMGQGAKADPDGHTIVLVATPLVINPSLYGTVPYDPIKDFDPVTLAVSTTTVLAIHPSVPAQTTRDLVAVIRANPGKYFSSPGTGTPSHILGELFRLSLKLDLVHVPFNSGAMAIASTLAGTLRFASARRRRHCRTSRTASCVRLRSLVRRGCRRCRMCPQWRKPAIRMSRAYRGLPWRFRPERPRRLSLCSIARLSRSWRCRTSRNTWRRSALT